MKFGDEVSLIVEYKNLEQAIIHSLEQDNTQVCLSKKIIGLYFTKVIQNPKSLATQNPARNDPLIKILMTIDASTLGQMATLPLEDKICLKVKTRLFVLSLDDLKRVTDEQVY